jgi:hypothetical protein
MRLGAVSAAGSQFLNKDSRQHNKIVNISFSELSGEMKGFEIARR